jgi:hypothetical protein
MGDPGNPSTTPNSYGRGNITRTSWTGLGGAAVEWTLEAVEWVYRVVDIIKGTLCTIVPTRKPTTGPGVCCTPTCRASTQTLFIGTNLQEKKYKKYECYHYHFI